MKKLLCLFSLIVIAIGVYCQEAPSVYTFNLKGGLFLGGPGKPNYAGMESKSEVSPMFKADLDGILVPKFSMGVFFFYTPMKVEDYDKASNFMSVGVTIKPRFTLAGGTQIVPGVAIGYNNIKNDDMEDASNGLNVGFQIEVSKKINDKIGIVGEWGFASQPVGGDGNYDLTFPPIMYLCIGIQFGK